MKIIYPFNISDLQIKLSRGVSFGECPAYEVALFGNGEVIYNGFSNVLITGEQKSEIDIIDLVDLFTYAVEIGFFEMKNEYLEGEQIMIGKDNTINLWTVNPTDQPYYDIMISTGNQIKKVHDYLGGPKRLRNLEKTIDKLAGSDRWIKGTGEKDELMEF